MKEAPLPSKYIFIFLVFPFTSIGEVHFIMIHDLSFVGFIWGSNFNYENAFLHLSVIHPHVSDGWEQHVVEGENWRALGERQGGYGRQKHTGEGLNLRDCQQKTGWLRISEKLAKCTGGVNSPWCKPLVCGNVKPSSNSRRGTLCL